MRGILLCLLSFILVGCAALGMPGAISERVSGFDNTTEISMEPAWLIGGSGAIKLGLYKTSKMNEYQVVLVAVVMGTYNFGNKDSLQFNIDGETLSLDSTDLLTNIETKEGSYNSAAYLPAYNESSKRYWVKKDFIKRLLDAKKVWVKVNLSSDYVDGEFSKDSPGAARPAFRKFFEKVWGNKQSEGQE